MLGKVTNWFLARLIPGLVIWMVAGLMAGLKYSDYLAIASFITGVVWGGLSRRFEVSRLDLVIFSSFYVLKFWSLLWFVDNFQNKFAPEFFLGSTLFFLGMFLLRFRP